VEREQVEAKTRHNDLILVVMGLQTFMRAASPRILRRVTRVGIVTSVLLVTLIFKDIFLPVLLKHFG
jgi:hypothetical protein